MKQLFLSLLVVLLPSNSQAQTNSNVEIKHRLWGTVKLKLHHGERAVTQYETRILIVDVDDNVKVHFFNKKGELSPAEEYVSGQAVYTSGSLDLSEYLPRDEVAIHARRVTNLKSGITHHVIVTWGANKDEGREAWPAFVYTIYVFLQNGSDVSKVYTERSSNSELREFWVKDVNNDRLTEIVDRGYEGNLATLSIRQILPDGKVQLVQRIEGRTTNFDPDGGIIFRQGLDELNGGNIVEVKEWYKWDRKRKRFAAVDKEILSDNRKTVLKHLEWDVTTNTWKEVKPK